ncbi:hypothetical protein QQ020_13860 [Fulvivirgaceae bacterium BMA12]|uniref:Transporter n=1 Tax=Agaribacillus aureus TaxID=3051825 RepID=A0ABT8L5Z0_9BACT|nr:hypothetical protein [Fulvivirgaceae bacterium BMA12]
MIRKLLLLVPLIIWSLNGKACDVCGCNLSGLYFGFMPIQNTHFIGIKYSRASFRAFIDNDGFYFEDESSNDTYQRFDLIGRVSLSGKFQIRYILPYMVNNMKGSHQNVKSSGLGDPIIVGYYTLFNTGSDFTRDVKHSLNLGAGFKLPVGEFDKQDNGELVNRNFQLGSGSVDYLVSANYTIRYKRLGLNMEYSHKFNTDNKHDYRFGNQFNVSGNVFYYLETNKVAVLPFFGAYYEWADYHKNQGIKEANTGGNSLLGTFGAQFFYNKLTVNVQYQIPLQQSFNTDNFASIKGDNRFSMGVYYSFSLKKDKK